MVGRFDEFVQAIGGKPGYPVGIGNPVAGPLGGRSGHIVGTLAVAIEKPAGRDMRPREVVSGGAETAPVGFAVYIPRGLRQLPPVRHPPDLPDDRTGGLAGGPVAGMFDNRCRCVRRVKLAAWSRRRAIIPRLARKGQLVDPPRVRVVGIGFQPARQFHVARPVFRRVKVTLRQHVAHQQFAIELFYQAVGGAPVAPFLDGEYFSVTGAVGNRQDVGQSGRAVLCRGRQGRGFGGPCGGRAGQWRQRHAHSDSPPDENPGCHPGKSLI